MSEGPLVVTGATGLVGRALVRAAVAAGRGVRVVARADAGGFPAGVEVVVAELGDADAVSAAVRGASGLIHLAGITTPDAPAEALFRLHVDVTRTLLRTAREAGVDRIVAASTAATLGPARLGDESAADDPAREDPGWGPGRRWFTPYEASKAAGEREAIALGAVVVHPARVFGPGPRTPGNSVADVIAAYRRGRFRVVPDGGGALGSWVYVDDVAAGCLLALERGAPGRRYLLAGEVASLRGFLDAVGDASGRRRRLVSAPGAVVRGLARLEELRASASGSPARVTLGHARRLLADYGFSSERAERELGWTWRPLAQGLRDTIAAG